MILVTGAAGKTGQAIIRALTARRAAVRAFVYRPEHERVVRALGVQETIVGDLADETAYNRAADGIDTIYHICPNMNPNEQNLGIVAINSAKKAAIKGFVYHSVLHPQTEQMPHHWHKLRTEERLFESGLNVTILQPAAYMQNILASWPTIVDHGFYRVPYPVQTKLGMVDLKDVAAVAARILTEPGHEGAIYELAGPDALTQTEVAETLAEVLGRPVSAEEIPHETWAEGATAAGLGSYQIETLLKMFRYYEAYGLWGNANVLRWLLGRPPTSFRSFVERVARSTAE